MHKETRSLRRSLLISFNGRLRMTRKMSNKKRVKSKKMFKSNKLLLLMKPIDLNK